MMAGVRYVAMSPKIGVVLVRGAIFGFSGIGVQALMPLVTRDLVLGGAATYGLLLGAFGVGAVGRSRAQHAPARGACRWRAWYASRSAALPFAPRSPP